MPIIPMEQGLYGLCRKEMDRDGFMPGYKGEVNAEIFAAHRLFRLQNTVRYACENSPWYRAVFDKAGVKPEDIRKISDLEKLPFTTPEDISAGGYKFLCMSQSGVEKPVTFVSTGTTGPQKRIFFSYSDVDALTDFLGVGMRTVAPEGSAVQILLPDSAVRSMGKLLCEGVAKQGLRGYSMGVMRPSEEQVEETIENRPYVWFGDARTIYRITKETENKYDLGKLGVKVMFTTVSEVAPSMRRYLEKVWNCRVVTHYGLTEMGFGLAVDCPDGCGYHYNEFGVIAELVDPTTGEVITDGREGELVYTSLGRQAMPIIRYRSHDISTLKKAPCRCGAQLDTIGHVARRMEAVLTVNGESVYPTMFDDLMFSNGHVVDYDTYFDEKGTRLVFVMECIGQPKGYAERVREIMAEHPAIKGKMNPPIVYAVGSGALKQTAQFKKLIRSVSELEKL
jgi:phenylacetate-CoA ligase